MTPAEENELICERLLGWRVIRPDDDAPLWCVPPTRGFTRPTPSFTTWTDAGLILDALQKAGQEPDLWNVDDSWYVITSATTGRPYENVPSGTTGPLAVRTAALYFIEWSKP